MFDLGDPQLFDKYKKWPGDRVSSSRVSATRLNFWKRIDLDVSRGCSFFEEREREREREGGRRRRRKRRLTDRWGEEKDRLVAAWIREKVISQEMRKRVR